ncbi:MAG TPA: hypothetical protein VIK62_06385 [Verrucomicrobiae bacterium]
MAKKTIVYLIVGVVMAVFAGCSPREEKIEGSVFIVTQGGENLKMGLVTVSIFDLQQIGSSLAEATDDLKKLLEELKREKEAFNEKKNKSDLAGYTLWQQYIEAKNLADRTLDKIGGDPNKRPEFSSTDEGSLKFSREIIVERDELKQKADRLSDNAEFRGQEPQDLLNAIQASSDARRALDDYDATYFSGFNDTRETLEGLERKKQAIIETQTNWDSLKPVYLEQVVGKNRLHEAYFKATDDADSYGKSLTAVTKRLQDWSAEKPQTYFDNLPAPLAVVKTDADGKFALQFSQKGEFILVAQAQRQVSDNTEKYFWLVRVHPDGKATIQVMLSNDNLITANSSDVAVRFPTP